MSVWPLSLTDCFYDTLDKYSPTYSTRTRARVDEKKHQKHTYWLFVKRLTLLLFILLNIFNDGHTGANLPPPRGESLRPMPTEPHP
jgi:hypothetical protein